MMVDDAEAAANWKALFERHVTVIALERGVAVPEVWEFKLPNSPMIVAMVQAYFEGVDGFKAKRSR